MVSVNPNPAQELHFFDPMNMGLPGMNTYPPYMAPAAPANPANPALSCNSVASTAGANSMAAVPEDQSKKVRKPYTITKSRESWTEQEHDKFLEALQLFDRDWKKIEAFVGSKTVIQIRSHAQKYFLKVQKSGTSERVPPPRPKRKAAHPYPQKAPKGPSVSQVTVPAAFVEPAYFYGPEPSSAQVMPVTNMPVPSWSYNTMPPVNVPQPTKDDMASGTQAVANTCCCSSSNESIQTTQSAGQRSDHGNFPKKMEVMPDFAQVYNFLGSIFDPNVTGQLQKLKQMDPINVETILLLMRNLCVNLLSPEFEEHRKVLSSYDSDFEKVKSGSPFSISHNDKLEPSVILSA